MCQALSGLGGSAVSEAACSTVWSGKKAAPTGMLCDVRVQMFGSRQARGRTW